MQKSNTSYSSVFLLCSVRSYIRISVPSLSCSRSGYLSVQWGLLSITRAFVAGICSGRVSVYGEHLTGDDSIACDCS